MTSSPTTSTHRLFLSAVAAIGLCAFATPALAHATADGRAGGLRLASPEMRVTTDAPAQPMVPELRLAEVEVVNSNPATPAPAAVPVAAAPAPVVAQAPVVVPPQREVVHHQEGSYMGTIAINALFGALAGGLVGGAIYYLADNQNHAQRIAYWAAGGVVVGAGVGVIQVMADNRVESVAMAKLPHDPAPTYRLALLTTRF